METELINRSIKVKGRFAGSRGDPEVGDAAGDRPRAARAGERVVDGTRFFGAEPVDGSNFDFGAKRPMRLQVPMRRVAAP